MERGPLARMRAGRPRSVQGSILTYDLISIDFRQSYFGTERQI
jgi:hypothetical protein